MISDLDVRLAETLTPTGSLQSEHGEGFLVPDETLCEPYPDGWWVSESRSGQPSGNGFYCHRCHLLYVKAAPSKIWHCGSYESLNPRQQLVTHRLGSRVAYEPVAKRPRPTFVESDSEQLRRFSFRTMESNRSLLTQAKDFVVRWLNG